LPAGRVGVHRRLDRQHQVVTAALDLVDHHRAGAVSDEHPWIGSRGGAQRSLIEAQIQAPEVLVELLQQRRLAGLPRAVDDHDAEAAEELRRPGSDEPRDQVG
jgi:hypothetical protein